MLAHWKIVLPAGLLLMLLAGAALAEGGLGLRGSVPLFSLSPQPQQPSQGLHIALPSVVYAPPPASAVPPDPWRYGPQAPLDSYQPAPGISIYYGISQTEYLGQDPQLYQLLPPSGPEYRALGFSFSYPF
jgi:hypothetical protein